MLSHSKTFALLLIEDHEMIDNFLGIGEGGDTGLYGFCHIMRHAVMIFYFIIIKDRSSLQYFITQGMGQSSMFLTVRIIVIGKC